jgi:hypothetical protein
LGGVWCPAFITSGRRCTGEILNKLETLVNPGTARILWSLATRRGGSRAPEFISLEEWWGRHLPDHYAAFTCLGSEWDDDADVTPFVDAHAGWRRPVYPTKVGA